eukprot:SAG31_NODE_3632_length_4047_cov_1.708207_1_plen_148_part_00
MGVRYATFAHLAGEDPTDWLAASSGLPAIDSLNVWPLVSGQNNTSPRIVLPLDSHSIIVGEWYSASSYTRPKPSAAHSANNCKISSQSTSSASVDDGHRKLLLGMVGESGWTGYCYPNASTAAGVPFGTLRGSILRGCGRNFFTALD